MVTVDTSVVVSALDASHEAHEHAAAFVERAGQIRQVAQVAAESYHVLSRVRPNRSLPPSAVITALRSTFPGTMVVLTAKDYWDVLSQAPQLGIVGGAVFDALIAAAARRADLKLVSRDLRAAATYAALQTDFELMQPGVI
jgi:predicted nucleic acid-binding protein